MSKNLTMNGLFKKLWLVALKKTHMVLMKNFAVCSILSDSTVVKNGLALTAVKSHKPSIYHFIFTRATLNLSSRLNNFKENHSTGIASRLHS